MCSNTLRFSLTLAAILAGAASARGESTLWYNGDYWVGSGAGAADEISSNLGYFRTYDDFTVSGPMWHVTRIWCNNAMRITGVTQASWEIRSGMAPGNGGTIVASGLNSATQTPNGQPVVFETGYTISVSGLDLYLAPGTYWLNIAPLVGSDPSTAAYLHSYTSFTEGVNAVGTPGNGANALLDYPGATPPFSALGVDLSMGVAGAVVVPEPSLAWFAVLVAAAWPCSRKYRKTAN